MVIIGRNLNGRVEKKWMDMMVFMGVMDLV